MGTLTTSHAQQDRCYRMRVHVYVMLRQSPNCLRNHIGSSVNIPNTSNYTWKSNPASPTCNARHTMIRSSAQFQNSQTITMVQTLSLINQKRSLFKTNGSTWLPLNARIFCAMFLDVGQFRLQPFPLQKRPSVSIVDFDLHTLEWYQPPVFMIGKLMLIYVTVSNRTQGVKSL